MEARPIEIANICSIFINSKTAKIRFKDLVIYSRLSMLIDSDNSPEKIIEYSIRIGLLNLQKNHVYATDIAMGLGKIISKPSILLDIKSKEYFIKNILFNESISLPDLVPLLQDFQPSQEFGTYIYSRSANESHNVINWLKTLNYLSLTENKDSIVLIRREYLEVLNQFLFKIRNKGIIDSETFQDLRNETGDKAELLTIEFEKQRLTRNGFPELAKLVERHSLINNYLGYDIMSYQGYGKNPTIKRYIESKGTTKSNYQFVFTKNERTIAAEKGKQYWIYCFKDVNSLLLSDYKPLLICNPVDRLNKIKVLIEPLDIFYSFKER